MRAKTNQVGDFVWHADLLQWVNSLGEVAEDKDLVYTLNRKAEEQYKENVLNRLRKLQNVFLEMYSKEERNAAHAWLKEFWDL